MGVLVASPSAITVRGVVAGRGRYGVTAVAIDNAKARLRGRQFLFEPRYLALQLRDAVVRTVCCIALVTFVTCAMTGVHAAHHEKVHAATGKQDHGYW